ncbi:MAG: prolipoprotein diacylglyceryl transferase [Chloroflexi bacterium]|nr:prolipoprotein diacylglyceryl transferase [Chloroflexota bacterium]
MEFHSEYLELFNRLQIRYYGLIIVIALMVAASVAAWLAQRDQKDPDHVWGALTWAIIPGIIGARLWFVFFPPATLTAGCGSEAVGAVCQDTLYMLRNFFDTTSGAIAIWSGGLGIFGAVIGGFLGVWLYMRHSYTLQRFFENRISGPIARFFLNLAALVFGLFLPRWGDQLRTQAAEKATHKDPGREAPLPLAEWLDIAGVVLPLGQAIGRWANYVNQELFGSLTKLPWGITIDAERWPTDLNIPLEHGAVPRFHPLFLYESLWNLAAFSVLRYLFLKEDWRRRFLPGDFFLLYIWQYSGIRFLLEFLRLEIAYLPGTTINSSQTITAIAFLASGALLLWRHRPGQPSSPTPEAV